MISTPIDWIPKLEFHFYAPEFNLMEPNSI